MITNQTKNKIISKEEKHCDGIWSKARGLMFSKKKNLIMFFDPEEKTKLHNCFVFFALDILVLDKNKKIVEIKRNFKPFTFWNAKKEGSYLIEMAFPADYEVGDRLSFDE
ncbi:MAG: DUF192 domain-containing protein [Candidatus Woesearchaeota archaeon]